MAWSIATSNRGDVGVGRPSLTGDCALVAAEASARLQKVTWTRVMTIVFTITPDGRTMCHAVTVYQMPTSGKIGVYDRTICAGGCTVELPTQSHDCQEIAQVYAKRAHIAILHAHFW